MYEMKGEDTCVQPAAQHRPKCYAAKGERLLQGAHQPLVAGMAGLEPANEGVKVPCLTAWLHPCVWAPKSPPCVTTRS